MMRTTLVITAFIGTMLVGAAANAADGEVPAAILEPAIAIQAALAQDVTAGVPDQALRLAAAAAAAGPSAAAIERAARDVATRSTLADARAAFGDLARALVTFIRSGDLTVPAGMRLAYCPMARKQWVQADGPIRNPYFGTKMLECGGFTD